MTAPEVELDVRLDAVVVHVRAGMDATVAPTLRESLTDAVDRHPHVVVDLTEVPTLDDVGLGLLVRAHRRARRRDGLVVLAGPSRFVITVLHTMHVDGLFPIFDDCPAALDWLRAEFPR
ncbi:STAS domain-containing protein [Actinoplanes sp. NPDC048967]|uniref:STAS domain-containing protein n=1 Tax=Actinoplanes sp. NPDC048967 TaxID=3155269 RepID=UPI00340527D9